MSLHTLHRNKNILPLHCAWRLQLTEFNIRVLVRDAAICCVGKQCILWATYEFSWRELCSTFALSRTVERPTLPKLLGNAKFLFARM